MTTFYEYGAIRITDEWLTVNGHRYRTGHLHNLRHDRGPADRPMWWMALTAGLALVVVVVVGRYLPAAVVLPFVSGFVVLPAAAAIIRVKFCPRPHLLQVDLRQATIQVYEGRDAVEFGKISRALVRATTMARERRCDPAPVAQHR